MSTTAAATINSVRDLIPDPVYNSSGVAQPDSDGDLFKAQTLYRWLSQAIKRCGDGMGWITEDWYAMAVTNGKPVVSLDEKWVSIGDAFLAKWALTPLPEWLTLYPTAQLVNSQAIWYSQHRLTDHVEMTLFPAVNFTDPTTTLNGALSASATSATVVDTTGTGWLPDGYVQIDSEIIKFESKTGTSLLTLSRGQCGTTAASHLTGATVTHLSAWIKGPRTVADVTASTSLIELPPAFISFLDLFVLSRARQSENEFQEAAALMKQFESELEKKKRDPFWQTTMNGYPLPAYGEPAGGPLAWGGRVIVR